MGVPSIYLFMSQQENFDNAEFSSLRLMIFASGPPFWEGREKKI